jgi:hypothetical protein
VSGVPRELARLSPGRSKAGHHLAARAAASAWPAAVPCLARAAGWKANARGHGALHGRTGTRVSHSFFLFSERGLGG